MTAPAINREGWLTTLATELQPLVEEKGVMYPHILRLSCGWPSRGGLSSRSMTIGQCWDATVSADGATEVFISPVLDDPVEVAQVVVHELIHASGVHGHGPKFARLARALCLEGKPTHTRAGEAFKHWVAEVLATVGPYPHAKLNPSRRGKVQSTRLVKVECEECLGFYGEPYIVRMSRKTINMGLPRCPQGHGMEVSE